MTFGIDLLWYRYKFVYNTSCLSCELQLYVCFSKLRAECSVMVVACGLGVDMLLGQGRGNFIAMHWGYHSIVLSYRYVT